MSRPSLFDRIRARLAVCDPVLDATNGPCLVLGSAPEPILPVDYGAHWTFVTVNAAQAGAAKAGIDRIPDLTVMSGQMLGKKPENLAGQKALRDARTTQLLLVERGVSAREARPALRALNYQYGALRTMDHWQRAGLTYRLLGEHLATGSGESKISTGVFAALLAASLGYAPIVMCGFSLSNDGHSYNPLGHRRQHREVDAIALRLLAKSGHAVFTSDPAFSASSGLPLWDGSYRPAVRSGPLWSSSSPSLQT